MMDIKFRGWNISMSEMVPHEGLLAYADNTVLMIPLQNSNFIFMHYTNMKDSKGNEIYEGDIIETKDSLDQMIIGEVFFEDGMFKTKWDRYRSCVLFTHNHESTVVGNIYENRELLDE